MRIMLGCIRNLELEAKIFVWKEITRNTRFVFGFCPIVFFCDWAIFPSGFLTTSTVFKLHFKSEI